MSREKRLYTIAICISLVTSLLGLFIYSAYSDIKIREEKISIEENKLDILADALENNENKLSSYQKHIKDIEDSIKGIEEDLNIREKSINTKKDKIKNKKIELENRQVVIAEKIKELEKKQEAEINKNGKFVYLTFDDGPSKNTYKILDILKENNAVATFFVNGRPGYEDAYLRMIKEGNKIGNHTYSHDYKKVYSSVEGFNEEVDKLNSFLGSIGIEKSNILRYPGGSNNTVSINYGGKDIMKKIIKEQYNKGYDYFDWNVSSEDATAITVDKQTIIKSVKNGCKGKKKVVILFHDSQPKTTTVEALPEIISYLKSEGYEFRTLQSGCAPWAKFSN